MNKKRHKFYIRTLTLALMTLSALFIFPADVSANTDLEDPLLAIQKNALHGNLDFAAMELHAVLRNEPGHEQSSSITLSLGQYYLKFGMYSYAEKYLKQSMDDQKNHHLKILTLLLLSETAAKTGRNKLYSTYHAKAEKLFLSKNAFFAFKEHKTHTWPSLLKDKFTFKEFVDRMEIYENQNLRFTLQTPLS